MSNLLPFFSLIGILSFIPIHQATGSDALQVIRHSLTLRLRNQVTVEQPNECTDEISHLQCDGELSGRYTWARENDNTNYVLFILNGRAVISRINLTYIVESSSEKPKVSFCAISDNATVNSNLTAAGLDCQEVPIEPTEGAARNEILPMPFNNDTSRIVMEVITQGIKTAFEATEVQFCGTFVKIETTSSPVSSTSGTIIRDSNQTESITNDITGGVSPGPMQTSKISILALTILALGLMVIAIL